MSARWQGELVRLEACPEAVAWAQAYPTLQSAWDACERADWMLWLLARNGTDERTLRLCVCACARTALPYVTPGDERPLRAIKAAERYAKGEGTREEMDAAGDAAVDAAGAAVGDAAVDAARAAAGDAAWAATGDAALKQMSALIRALVPTVALKRGGK